MDAIETEGKTVDEAVASALRSLGLRSEQSEIRVIQEASAGFLGMGAKPARVRVRIGAESGLPELRNASVITHVYRHGDQVLGVLGVIGSKRMEYSRMMGLVDYVGRLVEARLNEWDFETKGLEGRK